jgi:hypothetical protein
LAYSCASRPLGPSIIAWLRLPDILLAMRGSSWSGF